MKLLVLFFIITKSCKKRQIIFRNQVAEHKYLHQFYQLNEWLIPNTQKAALSSTVISAREKTFMQIQETKLC